jgi:hypothetical protein
MLFRFCLTRHSGVLHAGEDAGEGVAEAPAAAGEPGDVFAFADTFAFRAGPAELAFLFPALFELPGVEAEFTFLAEPFEFPFAGLFESVADEFVFDDEFDGGVGFSLAYSAAAATSESRIARSVDSTRTRAIESTFIAIVSNNPKTNMIN